jgi:hypothetical protein
MPRRCRDATHLRSAGGFRPADRRAHSGPRRWSPLAVVAAGLVACSSGQNHAAPSPPLLPSPSVDAAAPEPPHVTEFSEIVDEFEALVNLLAATPPLGEGEGLRRALDRLASAIRTIPGPPQLAGAEAAALMRARNFDVWLSLIREDATAAPIRELLAIAAGALTLATKDAYATKAAREATERFKRSVERLAAAEPLRQQRSQLVPILRDAVAALKAIRAAAPQVVARRN